MEIRDVIVFALGAGLAIVFGAPVVILFWLTATADPLPITRPTPRPRRRNWRANCWTGTPEETEPERPPSRVPTW